MLASFISETFELDGRLFRTLRALFTQPGFLAQEFSINRRAAYMSPARLYFFTSVLFFFMLSVFGPTNTNESEQRSEAVQVQIDTAIDEQESQQANGNSERKVSDPHQLEPLLSKAQQKSLERILASPDENEKRLAVEGLARTVHNIRRDQSGNAPWWLRTLAGKSVSAIEDPRELRRTITDNVPLAMFVLLPAYALLLKGLFYRRRPPIFYAEHFVFALYLHVLAFLIFSLNLLVPEETWYETPLLVATILYLGYYSYRAMRNYYLLSASQTTWRFSVLGLGYLLLFVPAFSVVMVYSFIAF